MYPFVNHPDVARIRVHNPPVCPPGTILCPNGVSCVPDPVLCPGGGGFRTRARQWYEPAGGMYAAASQFSCSPPCPGQICCPDGSCVNNVSECASFTAPSSRQPARRRRRKFRRRYGRNPTVVDYVLGAFGLRGMPGYR